MPREEPFFTKCCGCIPLKSCLHVWCCIKWVADVTLAVILSILVMLLVDFTDLGIKHFNIAHLFIIIIVVLVIDSVFMVVLTVGLKTNNLLTLRVFLYYCIYMVSLEISCFIGFLIYSFLSTGRSDLIFNITLVACGLINAVLDVCIIFTLKSEMIKLRNKQQFQFVQMLTLDKEEEEPRRSAERVQVNAENFDV